MAMKKRMRIFRRDLAGRVATITLTAGLAAGCSQGVERFGEAPIYTGGTANQRDILGSASSQQPSFEDIMKGPGGTAAALPPAGSQPVVTGSIPTTAPIKPRVPAPATPRYTAQVPVSPARLPPVETVAAPEVASVPSARTWRGWTSTGGTKVRVRSGDTVSSMSRRYGVPVEAVMAVNGIEDPRQVQPGQSVIIPTYVYSARNPMVSATASEDRPVRLPPVTDAAPVSTGSIPSATLSSRDVLAPAPQRKPVPVQVAAVEAPIIQSDGPAPRYSVSPKRKPYAAVKPVIPPATVTPSVSGSVPTPKRMPSRLIETAKPAPDVPQLPAGRSDEVKPSKPLETPQIVASVQPEADTGPKFRWPARGRIISGFGAKPGGDRNDGVNLAVPEGTPVKAAGEGSVIYSGNELKGYGNLVLIRHADGWVSAYAHNSALKVKRGDKVSRGQVIAEAGKTGSVTQPQVHFELRRGNKPVDPLKFLPKS